MIKRALGLIAIAIFIYVAFLQAKPSLDALTATDIATLQSRANEFDGRKVSVTGVVQQSAAILGHGGFSLRQGESEIWVLGSRGVPTTGSLVTVAGTFRQAVKIGAMQVAVLMQD